MACGCPLVISDIPVFHEVCGDAGWYVNHTNQAEIMAAMLRLMEDKQAADSRKEEGIRRAKLFSRQQSVRLLEEEINAAGY
jgi:glycosyltransferase involved in cell wall biosynthesis